MLITRFQEAQFVIQFDDQEKIISYKNLPKNCLGKRMFVHLTKNSDPIPLSLIKYFDTQHGIIKLSQYQASLKNIEKIAFLVVINEKEFLIGNPLILKAPVEKMGRRPG